MEPFPFDNGWIFTRHICVPFVDNCATPVFHMCANEKTLATTKLVCWLTPCGRTFKGAKGGVGELGAVKILALQRLA